MVANAIGPRKNVTAIEHDLAVEALPNPYLSVCLSIYLSIYLSISLSINLSINKSIYLSIYQSIYSSIYLAIYLVAAPSRQRHWAAQERHGHRTRPGCRGTP